MGAELRPVSGGFLPLLDAAILIAAKTRGFAAAEGIDLQLSRETSWANVRDRLAVGHFHIAHLLAPMPIASRLGLTPLALDLIAPMALGLGGNAVTVGDALWRELRRHGLGDGDRFDPADAGRALAALVRRRRDRDAARLSLAVVHPHSGHNYELRYWLAACGIDPQRDVDLVIVPPPLMTDALRAGRIDGFCVGEPWNSVAVAGRVGHILTTKSMIWRRSPEKVLGVSADWARREPTLLDALLRALHRAAQWCGDAANRAELAAILAGPDYLDQPVERLLPALSGVLRDANDPDGAGGRVEVADFFVPAAGAATFPWQSHALWFYTQMVRWGQIEHRPQHVRAARDTYRPDLYRAALAPIGATLPGANAKVEGALGNAETVGASGGRLTLGPDGFFDGKIFDPDRIDDYIDAQTALKSIDASR